MNTVTLYGTECGKSKCVWLLTDSNVMYNGQDFMKQTNKQTTSREGRKKRKRKYPWHIGRKKQNGATRVSARSAQCASNFLHCHQTAHTSHMAAPSSPRTIRRKLLWNDDDHHHDDHDNSSREPGNGADTTLTTHCPLCVPPSNETKLQMWEGGLSWSPAPSQILQHFSGHNCFPYNLFLLRIQISSLHHHYTARRTD